MVLSEIIDAIAFLSVIGAGLVAGTRRTMEAACPLGRKQAITETNAAAYSATERATPAALPARIRSNRPPKPGAAAPMPSSRRQSA